jgi:regulator of sirC expression with transglutaminase-like and TPR domain
MDWTAPSPLDYFAALVADEAGFALTEAAIAIAQDETPELDVMAIQAEIDALARRVERRLPRDASALARLRMLHHVFYEELGFAGNINDYYSAGNSYIHEVLGCRRGIPISLAVIYLEIAAQIGLPARGVSFPGHFLIKLELPRGDVVIDPMSGHSLSREALDERLSGLLHSGENESDLLASEQRRSALAHFLQPATPREIIARMLRNLEAIHRSTQDWPRLLAVLERLVVLQPGDCEWRRERGLTLEHLGDRSAALSDLTHYLRHADPAAKDRAAIRQHVARLREAGPTRWH